MTANQRRAWELILKHRDFYGTYHNHKETMAYLATAFYLGGMWAVIFSTAWHAWSRPRIVLLVLGVVVAMVLILVFVWWQFQRRIFGARIVAVCTDLAAIWLTRPPEPAELSDSCLDDRRVPAAIVTRFPNAPPRCFYLPRELTLVVIVLAAAAAIAIIATNAPTGGGCF